MPSTAEIRQVSLRTLQKSATQYWKKPNGQPTRKALLRVSSMPQLKQSAQIEEAVVVTDNDEIFFISTDEEDIVMEDDAEYEENADGRFQRKDGIRVLEIKNEETLSVRTTSMSETDESFLSEEQGSESCRNVIFGFQTLDTYKHHTKLTDLINIIYNGRTHRFLLLDSRGIMSWLPESDRMDAIKRELAFPKYKTKLLRNIIFCRKHNVYFAIGSDFTLKVYNRDFVETYKTENKTLRSVLHLVFNPVTDELISSGVAGTIVWKYQQTENKEFDNIKPMANYSLVLNAEYPDIGGTWCTKIELVAPVQYLFYCAEVDLIVYDAGDMRKLFCINGAHKAAITCVSFSALNRLVLTGGMDSEVKVWSVSGGHVCTLRGHSRPVCSLVLHPDKSGLLFSGSLDGTVKVWSLQTMDLFHSFSVFTEGIQCMSLTEDGSLWCANGRKISLLRYTPVVSFWGHARCNLTNLEVITHPNKSSRLMAVGEDGSVRLFSHSASDASTLCTVLPPPVVSLLDNVQDVSHSRFNHLFFVLINPTKLWIYTAKTDPACRVAQWDIPTLLKEGRFQSTSAEGLPEKSSSSISISSSTIRNFEDQKVLHKCTQLLTGKAAVSDCRCILAVYSEHGFQYDTPLGICSAKSRHLLLLGLEDGRIVFADQKARGVLYCELRVNKEAIVSMKHKSHQNWLVTQCGNTHDATFQIWSLPELEMINMICCPISVTAYAVLDELFIIGFSTGHIFIHSIVHGEHCTITKKHLDRPSEHKDSIVSIKSCRRRGVFCSCSVDGVIKLWDMNKILLANVQLGSEVSCCNFLNAHGDLVVGWKRHLYLIDHKTILKPEQQELFEDSEKDSDIYEDPAIRYESGVKPKSDSGTLTMRRYLVPYGFVETENVEDMDFETMDQKLGSELSNTSEDTQVALTDTYMSPAISYESFGVIDALFPPKSEAITQQTLKDEMIMPQFGDSPGSTSLESSISEESKEYEEIVSSYYSEEEDVFDGFDPIAQDAGSQIDILQEMSKATKVAKAIKKMKKENKEPQAVQESAKSRFAGMKLDSKALMKKGMNVVVATEAFKANGKAAITELTGGRQLMARRPSKKTRRPSTASIHHQSQTSDIQLPQGEADEISAGDFASEGISDEKVGPRLNTINMGIKMNIVPHTKVDSIPAKHTQFRRSSAAVEFQKRKQAVVGMQVSSGVPGNSKLRRRGGKSSPARRRGRSSFDKGRIQLEGSTVKEPPTQPLTKQRVQELDDQSRSARPFSQGGDSEQTPDTSSSPVTHVQMVYKRPHLFSMKQADNGHNIAMDKAETGISEAQFLRPDGYVEKSEECEEPLQGSKPLHHQTTADEEKITIARPASVSRTFETDEVGKEISKPTPDPEEKKNVLSSLRTLKEADDSGDEDEMIIPNLLEYDFQAIYKKDGLQFDEKWQDRMLERYLLMKLQKRQRQEAAMSKRIYLEHERQLKLITSNPDLLQKITKPWLEDPEALANYVLNSALSRAETKSSNCLLYGHGAHERTTSQMPSRPYSSASNQPKNGKKNENLLERDSNFRFTIRPKSCDNIQMSYEELHHRNMHTPLPCAPANSRTSLTAKSSASSQQFAERPRSSTSIPGKTRYILIKPEVEQHMTEKAPTPTKLEEQLLRKRFPAQHMTVMRSLGRLDEIQPTFQNSSLHDISTGAAPEYQADIQQKIKSDMLRERTIKSAPSSAHWQRALRSRRNEGDELFGERRKTSYKSTRSLRTQSEAALMPVGGNSWKYHTSSGFINPLDIVKRRSSPAPTPLQSRKNSVRSISD